MKASLHTPLVVCAILTACRSAAQPDVVGAAARCCTLLQLSHANETYLPASAGYQKSIGSYWSLQARTNPTCIVTPASAFEVSQVTTTLVNNTCPFAIRSGGHTPFPDNNIGAPGITIDLSRLSSVSVVKSAFSDGKVAAIGPGAKWADVYDYLSLPPRGYGVPGGRAASVGVGGLTLGGGNSFFSAEYGFVCDNVENFEIVLADGRIVNANAKENPDLWQVLKGGSNNFGIVTRIDLTTFDLPRGEIWGGVVIYPNTTIPDQIKAFAAFTDNIEKDPAASLITFLAYTSAAGMTVVQNCYEYTKPEPPTNAPIFKDLLTIQPEVPNTNTLRVANLTSLTTEIEAKFDLRDLFATLSFNNDPAIIEQVYEFSQVLLEPVKATKGLNWITMFQPLPTIFSKHSVARGGNVMGLDRAKGNQVLFLFFLQWEDAADDAVLNTAAETLMQQVTDLTRSKGKANDWIYLNYALQSQDPLASYGPENVAKMMEASRKYDPDGVFQKLVPGGFKVSNVKASAGGGAASA